MLHDMLQYAAYLSNKGVPVIAIPKTIHNNIHGTDYSLGFSTGLARGVAFIHELRALAGSREQIIVVETFAAKSGYSTLLLAFLSGSDRVIIPEVPYDPERLTQLIRQDQRETPSNYAVLTVCDGATISPEKIDAVAPLLSASSRASVMAANGLEQTLETRNISSGEIAAELLVRISGEDVFLQPLTYLLRTGAPDGQDLLGAANFAITAARLLKDGEFGRMAAFRQNTMWTHVDLNLALEGVKTVDVEAWYDQENYKPKLSIIWSADNG